MITRHTVSLLPIFWSFLTHRHSLRPVFCLADDRQGATCVRSWPSCGSCYYAPKIPFILGNAVPDNSPPSDRNLPDVYAILACVEHTASGSTGSKGFVHNRDHAYAKLNELLKCPPEPLLYCSRRSWRFCMGTGVECLLHPRGPCGPCKYPL